MDIHADGTYLSTNRTEKTSESGTWRVQNTARDSDPVIGSLFASTDKRQELPSIITFLPSRGEPITARITEYLDQPFSVSVYGMRLQPSSQPDRIMEFYPADTPEYILKPTRAPR